MTIDRRDLLARGAKLAAAAVAWPGACRSPGHPAPESPAATVEPPLWREFLAAPFTHPQIPNVSFAGYRMGVRPAAAGPTIDAVARGARPDGSQDAAPVLNRALAEAGAAGGGVVVLGPGQYRIDGVVQLGWPGVVLRGAGSDRTVLVAGKSLTDLIGVHRHPFGPQSSAWSWTGGLLWVCHHQRYQALVEGIRATTMAPELWTGGEVLAVVSEDAGLGAFELTVSDPARVRAGDRVLLALDDDASFGLLRQMAGGGPGTARYDWGSKAKLLASRPFLWPVRIAAVVGRRVRLTQPLPLDARVSWNARLTSTGPVINEAGVEGLTLRMPRLPQARHLQDAGWNGLLFQCAWDCWAEDVRVIDADNAFLLTCAKGVTLSRTRVAGRMRHHSYTCREQSHDNLFQDFLIERAEVPLPRGSNHHGLNVEGFSCGNVWSRGRLENGTFDTHRLLPFGNVRTEIVLHNDGAHGGSVDAGPLYGARFAHWNIQVTNQRAGCVRLDAVAPRSATVGVTTVREFGQVDRPDFDGPLETRLEGYGGEVAPRNLYEAQRKLRG